MSPTRSLLLVLAAFAAGPAAADSAAAPPLALAPCTAPGMEAFRCGTLTVPENPEAPDARTITLNLMISAAAVSFQQSNWIPFLCTI